ncbi:AAA family ATPase [Thalassolituus pacificus]|uniref:AAA family ATPase n=1 Tax=Thalassolituus pacificus TaxID=2975440 RepID=A0A9X3AHX3_9GAMM|nr:AAA family ATPase [Thalassolituus pacificus]MCT7359581.1 AAA family ATPase [Thalassolituus pacificus]
MIGMYRLERIFFYNFKLFSGDFSIRFGSNDLIVFDGPNGYGKTSVYDAVELAITGNIRRFTSTESQQNPDDVVVAHNNDMNCYVRLELKNSEGSITVERCLKDKISNSDKKIINFRNLWDIYLIDGDDRRQISQLDLNDLLKNPNVCRDFTLFHYVEQEDTAHFLKGRSEKDRANALSVLFGDTVEMQEKVSKVLEFEKRLGDVVRDKDRERKILENRGNLNVSEEYQGAEAPFIPLLKREGSSFEWDKQTILNFSVEKRDSFLLELKKISALVENREFFLKYRVHSRATLQREVLMNFLAYSKHMDRLEEFKEGARQMRLVSSIASLLGGKLDSLLESPFLLECFDLVGYKNGEEFVAGLRDIVDGKKYNDDSSKVVSDLLSFRTHLQAHLDNNDGEKECLLCGSSFESHTHMMEAIKNKELALRSVLSVDEKRLDGLLSEFLSNTLPLFSRLVELFLERKAVPSADYISALESAKSVEDRIERLKLWLDKQDVTYSDLLLPYREESISFDELEENLLLLNKRIMSKVEAFPDGYEELESEMDFESVFGIYFDSKVELLNAVESTDIEEKQKYIQKLFFQSISNDIKAYETLISDLSKLNAKKDAIASLRTKLKKSISRYQKLLIKDVELPFYIYSGKVLQAHQSGIGNGIFIKDKTGGDELKNIRFVSNWKSDHDVINTMSSGQIAAVVITLYLALNKVYAKGLAVLLIDDPVQTMDEINMISLVELLRNEFSDRQIILSTHEDHVSKYFLYKFLKYRKSVRQIKLMERKEFQLSND